ncbi:MAG: helix-turn-helix domain-containing protein [Burkholderiaceae bacterium]
MYDHLLKAATIVRTIDDFKQWTRDVIRPLFPHEALGCGYGRLHAGGVGIDGIIAVDYPTQHLKDIRNKAGCIDTPILRRWLVTREPQLFESDSPWSDIPQQWLDGFQRNAMKNAAAHAVYDTERCLGTYHSFHRIPGRLGESHAQVLKQLVPIMHEVLCSVIGDLGEGRRFETLFATLSPREMELLRWVGQGKTNSEIANAIFLSEITVKHHMMKIYSKLGIANRAQLVRLLVEYEERTPPEFGLKVL